MRASTVGVVVFTFSWSVSRMTFSVIFALPQMVFTHLANVFPYTLLSVRHNLCPMVLEGLSFVSTLSYKICPEITSGSKMCFVIVCFYEIWHRRSRTDMLSPTVSTHVSFICLCVGADHLSRSCCAAGVGTFIPESEKSILDTPSVKHTNKGGTTPQV